MRPSDRYSADLLAALRGGQPLLKNPADQNNQGALPA